MASKSGMAAYAIYQISSTWGTAVAGGAGDKLEAEISPNFNVEELTGREIGSGNFLTTYTTKGNLKPTVDITADGKYRSPIWNMVAQAMGTAGAPTEQTAGQGDYKHTITLNTTRNAKYGTLSFEDSSATVLEFPSTTVTSLEFDIQDAPGILDFKATLLANDATLTTAVNTNAVLQAATSLDSERVAFDFADTFQINANTGGSLSSGDNLAITGYNLKLDFPQSLIGEIKGSSGNGAPILDGLMSGTLTITLKEQADHTYHTIWSAETAQKSKLNIQGTQIGTGVNKAVTIYIPKMLLIQEPQYALTSEGTNPLTMTFKIILATSNPTGMSSPYPYFEVINGQSTTLLA